jgi:EAL domain-containing protein (putative c-di-GMP-specific phosphodiesterase class I)
MQTYVTSTKAWFLISNEADSDLPSRIAVTPPFRVGRREGFDLCLSCRTVSGLHAELLEENGQLWIDDLNSTNGTFVNETRIRAKTMLCDGDTVQFGSTSFSVSCPGESRPAATLVFDGNDSVAVPESTEERFHRLLREGVVPYFQPIYDISNAEKQRVGYEVLGRSRLFGLKTPDQMFAAATDFEMESELSRVLRLRGVEAAASELPEDQMLFVNTHSTEMECSNIQDSMKELRKKFPSRSIMLELPERVLYTPEAFSEMCNTLKDLEVKLLLHDFGAGQIRLAELSELSPNVVKFDSALLQEIDKADQKRHQLVAAMVKMAAELGITPMAEFVETEGEHETLKQLGFVLVQGFYYGHPAPVESLEGQTGKAAMAAANEAPKMRPLEQLKNLESSTPQAEAVQIDASETSDDENRVLQDSEFTKSVKDNAPNVSDRIRVHDGQWLLDQKDDCFTIQLMFASSEDEAEQFVAQRDQPGDYAIYRKRGLKREWFVLVHGIFNQRELAKAASTKFEGAGHSSWTRSLSSVQSEVRSFEIGR